jgi:hypothetical protein
MAVVRAYYRDSACVIPFRGVSYICLDELKRFLVMFSALPDKYIILDQTCSERFMDEFCLWLDAREVK